MNEELVYEASILKQEAEKLQANLETIERQISELGQISGYLSHLNKYEGKEIISSLGKGIHIKTQLLEKNLFVEVGSGAIVRKTPEETLKVIEEQLKRLMEFKVQLSGQEQVCMQALNSAISEIQKQSASNKTNP